MIHPIFPGFAQKEWSVSAIDDGIQERKEKFKMLLHSPVNAVLETQRKDSVITIRDARSRSCRQSDSLLVTGNLLLCLDLFRKIKCNLFEYIDYRKKKSRRKNKAKKRAKKSSRRNGKRRKTKQLPRDEAG